MMQAEKPLEDKRCFNRVVYFAEATLASPTETWLCTLTDLSLQGCLLKFPTPWSGETKKPYRLTIPLSEEVEIAMTVSLAHTEGTEAGFYCESIDLDSVSQLRRLIELNLGDSRLLERDLSALAYSNGKAAG